MSEITYIHGDATNPPPPAIIAHICNNRGGWGKGFTGALSKRWQRPEKHFRQCWDNKYLHKLGDVQLTLVKLDIWVANMIAQDGYSSPGRPAIDYEALRLCLSQLAWLTLRDFHAYTVHMPRIGTGLAGGDWAVIERLIMRELCEKGVKVTVYEYREKKSDELR